MKGKCNANYMFYFWLDVVLTNYLHMKTIGPVTKAKIEKKINKNSYSD